MRAALALLATLALPPAALAADVFRCVENGVTTYQDFPCRTPDSGKVVRLIVPEAPPPAANAAENSEEARRRLDALTRERRQREISAEIERLEQNIARIERQEAAELDVLRNQRGFAANNFKADGWDRARVDRAMADEMATVSAKYRERTEPARRRIVELRNEQKTLTAARQ